jgi:hypothetical protein
VSSVELLRRLERSALITLAVLTLAAFLVRPAQPRFALGIAGGGVLAAISYWGILGLIPGHSRAMALVKFFTRHAILAFAAYVMMARLELHPVGMLVGVSVPILAAAVEAVRSRTK